MEISFSRHALSQLEARNIAKQAVIDAVKSPDKIFSQSVRRSQAIKRIEKLGKSYLLAVIFDEINFHQQIVTAFITAKIKKYL